MWKQRSRIQWINEGDNNTKNLHNMANGRKHINTINSIIINNKELVDQRDLNKAFTDYYKDIFDNKNTRRINARWNDLYPSDSIVDLSELDNAFTKGEIWKAINDLPKDKSLGPDGFSIFFYKSFILVKSLLDKTLEIILTEWLIKEIGLSYLERVD